MLPKLEFDRLCDYCEKETGSVNDGSYLRSLEVGKIILLTGSLLIELDDQFVLLCVGKLRHCT